VLVRSHVQAHRTHPASGHPERLMIKKLRLDKYSALYLWAFFMIYFGMTQTDTFLSVTTVKLVVVENVIVGVLALAFLVPLTTGTYDLSIGSMMSMSLVSATFLAQKPLG